MSGEETAAPVTIGDVAREAGVSLSTVSYALSGKRPISEATRQRIEASVARLGYRPHAGARALASRRTAVIALVAPLRVGVDVSVILQFVAGVATRARTHDYDVLLLTDEDERSLDRVATSSMVDAAVVMDVEREDPRLPELRRLRQPVVLIGLPDVPSGLGCVDLDFEAAGRLAVDHLHGQGRRRIGLIGAPAPVLARRTSYVERLRRGYDVALAGQTPLTASAEASRQGGESAVLSLLARDPALDALVVHNERALPGVWDGLRRSDRLDVEVLPICPADVAQALPRRCSWVEIPANRIGEIAVDMVIQRLAGQRGEEIRLVPPQLLEHQAEVPLSP